MKLLQGHCLEQLRTLPDESVHCVVTSPPYWSLRDYKTPPVPWPAVTYSPMPGVPPLIEIPAMEASLGLEPTLEQFIGHIVLVFREVRRVLRKDGVCWVNMGDSYAGSRCGGDSGASTLRNPGQKIDESAAAKRVTVSRRRDDQPIPRSDLVVPGLKPKDLIGQPWRVAFALQADGWWLRQGVIWAKRNPMPESVTDRCTKAHEDLFMLSKSARYWSDFEAVKEEVSEGTHPRRPGNKSHKGTDAYQQGDESHRTKGGLVAYAARQRALHGIQDQGVGRREGPPGNPPEAKRAQYKTPDGWDTSRGAGGHGSIHRQGREKGRKLADKEAGRAEQDLKLGEAFGRPPGWRTKSNSSFDKAMAATVELRNLRDVWHLVTEPYKEAHFATFPTEIPRRCILATCPAGGVVLDPFNGSGTTGKVAMDLGRQYIGIELNPEYVALTERRVHGMTTGLPLGTPEAEAA